ncbi:MAG: GNAT family N-acetyltransferase [Polyangiaceae bacterium]
MTDVSVWDGFPLISIRPAVPEDAEQLGRLAYQLVKLHYEWDPQRFIKIDDPNAPRYGWYLSSRAGEKDTIVLVATIPEPAENGGGKIVGYTYARMEPKDWNDLRDPCGMLHDIFVDAASRRKGIARRLATETFTQLEQLGAPRIVLKTAAKNEAGQKFFAAMGFRDTMIEMTREAPKK